MAAATTIVAAASLGLGTIQAVSGASRARQAEKAIEEFERQKLINPFKDLPISTLKSEQQTEAGLSRLATSVDVLQRGGTRAILGGLPRVSESNIMLQNLISQDLEEQENRRNLLIAQGEEKIRAIQENREVNALLGLGQSLQVGRQDTASGIQNIISSGLALSSSTGGGNTLTKSGAFNDSFKQKPIDLSVPVPELNFSSTFGKKSPFIF